MNRRSFLSGALAAMLPLPAFALDRVDDVVRDLRRQGYGAITIGRTLLGRTRIVATGTPGRREIVVNPRTGEILRDFWDPASGARSGGSVDYDDEGSDDDNGSGSDDDGDNSGHGSGDDGGDDNSGHGGGDDGGGDDNSGPGGGDD
ncbi:MAG: hypothetical protein KDK12_06620 [Rhodobacteraceae bacterium]|nr:hypothetical protein [Paracoccaceae bacterium]